MDQTPSAAEKQPPTIEQMKEIHEAADEARRRVSKMSRVEKKELEDSARRKIKAGRHSGQAVDKQEWPDVIGSGGNAPSGQAVDRQEWTDKQVAEILTTYSKPQLLAILADERKRRAQAVEGCRSMVAEQREIITKLESDLLSALAAIEEGKEMFAHWTKENIQAFESALKSVDLSLLHQHDAELRAQWEKERGS